MCGKEWVSSRGLKRHTTLKYVQEEVTPKEQKKLLITIDEFMNIVKKCADSCNADLCLPEDTRKMFSSFDFTPDDAVDRILGSFKTNGWKVSWKCRKLLFKFLWFIARKFMTKIVWWWHCPNKHFITRSWQSYFNAFVNKENSLW